MNAIYSAGAQTFGLLKAKGLTFIPLKVRLLLFRYIIFPFEFSMWKNKIKEKEKVSSIRYGQRVLIG